jgi:type VI secretion system protein VasG
MKLQIPEKHMRENLKALFVKDDSVLELIGPRCTELERVARMVDALITNTILPEIGREFLTRLAAGGEMKRVHVTAKDGNFDFVYD